MFNSWKFVLAAVFLLVSGCQNGVAHKKQTVRINIGFDPQTLDPRKARDLTSTTVVRMLFEGLTRPAKNGGIEMGAADRVEISEDGLRYTFHLRKMLWSNGEVLTSFDFAESWKAILDPHFPTDISYQLYVIKNARKVKQGELGLEQVGIFTPDPTTLIVELEQQAPYFLELVSTSSFFPVPSKMAAANPLWAVAPEGLICNGPFALARWNHSEQIQLVKNNRYWQAKEIQLSGIDLFMMSADTELRMFESGLIDWAGSPLSTVPADAIATLKKEGALRARPFCATYFYRMNTSPVVKGKKNPLSSPAFRKALSLSLNRKEITEHVLQGGQQPALSLVPPELGLEEKGYFRDCDIEKARAYLVDALLELDLTLDHFDPVRISYASSERNAALAQAVQQQWKKSLGIHAELEPIEPKVFFLRIAQKDFQLAAGSWTADFEDPINFLEVFKYKDTNANNTKWESAKYIDLLNQSAVSRGQDRKAILREAEQILMEQMPVLPLFHFASNYLQSDLLEGVILSSLGQIDFRWAHKGE